MGSACHSTQAIPAHVSLVAEEKNSCLIYSKRVPLFNEADDNDAMRMGSTAPYCRCESPPASRRFGADQQRPERSSPEIILPVLKCLPGSNRAVGCHSQREKILTAGGLFGIKDFVVYSFHGGPTAVVVGHRHLSRRAGLASGV